MDSRILLGRLASPAGTIANRSSQTCHIGSPSSSDQCKTERSSSVTGNSRLFETYLRQSIESANKTLKISAHAEKRLEERNIALSDGLRETLTQAISELSAKGAKDSLILAEGNGFLVNIPTKTLVTALNMGDLKDRIITQIDSISIKS